MLPVRLSAKTLTNATRAVRRGAARIALLIVPAAERVPFIDEALCYGCMAGVLVPAIGAASTSRTNDADAVRPLAENPS